MNKLLLVCILVPLVAECISALDLCSELKCGTADASDACNRLNCAVPNNIAAPPTPQNSTAATTSEATSPTKDAGPSNYAWPSYPGDWGYSGMADNMPFPFQMGYAPIDPYYGYQGGYQADYPGAYQPGYQADYQPYQYPFY